MLANVDAKLAAAVADGLGIAVPEAMPRATDVEVTPEVVLSPAVSLKARAGDGSVAGLRVALIVADGVDAAPLMRLHAALLAAHAVPRMIGSKLGSVTAAGGQALAVETTFDALPSCLWDGVVLPSGAKARRALAGNPAVPAFIEEAWRHGKAFRLLADAESAESAEAGDALSADQAFIAALAAGRDAERIGEPPAL
jgi:catalase